MTTTEPRDPECWHSARAPGIHFRMSEDAPTMTTHTLTQEPDEQGYDDGLEDWRCTCGATFSAGEIGAAFEHGRDTMTPAARAVVEWAREKGGEVRLPAGPLHQLREALADG